MNLIVLWTGPCLLATPRTAPIQSAGGALVEASWGRINPGASCRNRSITKSKKARTLCGACLPSRCTTCTGKALGSKSGNTVFNFPVRKCSATWYDSKRVSPNPPTAAATDAMAPIWLLTCSRVMNHGCARVGPRTASSDLHHQLAKVRSVGQLGVGLGCFLEGKLRINHRVNLVLCHELCQALQLRSTAHALPCQGGTRFSGNTCQRR